MASKPIISKKQVENYCAKTYRISPGFQIHTQKEAVNFVNERGFIFFWPISGIQMPSLWCSVAGDRPVPNEHDDPGHVTWRWKDDLLGKKKWYYAKVLRRKSTIISLDLIPNFFALSPSVQDGIGEITFHYKRGTLSAAERFIFQQLMDFGPTDTISLRKKFISFFSQNSSNFDRALELLQRNFRIAPSGISNNGRWKYSYIFQIVSRDFPELVERSKEISKDTAAETIIKSFFKSNGVGMASDLKKILGWPKVMINVVISSLLTDHEIIEVIPEWDKKNFIYSIPELV